jgi:hypothetical protein
MAAEADCPIGLLPLIQTKTDANVSATAKMFASLMKLDVARQPYGLNTVQQHHEIRWREDVASTVLWSSLAALWLSPIVSRFTEKGWCFDLNALNVQLGLPARAIETLTQDLKRRWSANGWYENISSARTMPAQDVMGPGCGDQMLAPTSFTRVALCSLYPCLHEYLGDLARTARFDRNSPWPDDVLVLCYAFEQKQACWTSTSDINHRVDNVLSNHSFSNGALMELSLTGRGTKGILEDTAENGVANFDLSSLRKRQKHIAHLAHACASDLARPLADADMHELDYGRKLMDDEFNVYVAVGCPQYSVFGFRCLDCTPKHDLFRLMYFSSLDMVVEVLADLRKSKQDSRKLPHVRNRARLRLLLTTMIAFRKETGVDRLCVKARVVYRAHLLDFSWPTKQVFHDDTVFGKWLRDTTQEPNPIDKWRDNAIANEKDGMALVPMGPWDNVDAQPLKRKRTPAQQK